MPSSRSEADPKPSNLSSDTPFSVSVDERICAEETGRCFLYCCNLDDTCKLFVVDGVFIVEVVLQKDDIQGSMTASSPVASSAQPSGCIRIHQALPCAHRSSFQ